MIEMIQDVKTSGKNSVFSEMNRQTGKRIRCLEMKNILKIRVTEWFEQQIRHTCREN